MDITAKIYPWRDLPDSPGLYLVELDDLESDIHAIWVGYGEGDSLVAWVFGSDEVTPVDKVPFVRPLGQSRKGAGMISLFLVWDPENENEDEGRHIPATNPLLAAIRFAERDAPGRDSGLYTLEGAPLTDLKHGHRLNVRDEDGALHSFLVGITEFTAQFDAKPVAAEEGRA